MVDIYFFIRISRKVHLGTRNEIHGVVLQDHGHYSLIGSGLSGLEAEQSCGIEEKVCYRFRYVTFISNPANHLRNIICIPCFVCRSVQFAKYTTPIPLFYFVLDICGIDFIICHQHGTNCRKRNQLCTIRQVSAGKNTFLHQKFFGYNKPFAKIICILLISLKG